MGIESTDGSHKKHPYKLLMLVQSKILIVDKLIRRSWPCNPNCSLCDQEPEPAAHLCLLCVFAREVWMLISSWFEGLILMPENGVEIEEWWENSLRHLPKVQRHNTAALMMYAA